MLRRSWLTGAVAALRGVCRPPRFGPVLHVPPTRPPQYTAQAWCLRGLLHVPRGASVALTPSPWPFAPADSGPREHFACLPKAHIYPTAMAMSGKGWLTSDAAEMCDTAKPPAANCAAAVGRDDLTRWVLENLRREAAASLTAPTAPAQRSAPPSATGPIADTGHPVRR